MIAELHGKISGTGSNLSDRLEDKLTGDVFGALRYLPFHMGMAQILRAANISALTECVDQTDMEFWGDRIQFWPYHEEGEMDAFLELDHAVIAIEVKYMSGLSSDDDVENPERIEDSKLEESHNQLARESRIIKQWCPAHKKPYLIFIAKESECAPICNHVKSRAILEPGVELGYVSWQEILARLSQIEANEPHQKLILNDLTSLLKRKGFERFQNFTLADAVDIDAQGYFDFDYQTTTFSFDILQSVNGGNYFEYR